MLSLLANLSACGVICVPSDRRAPSAVAFRVASPLLPGDDLERFQAEAVELRAAAAELRQLRAK